MIDTLLVGACGRMGREVARAALADGGVRIAAAVERPGHADLGKDAGLVAGGAPSGFLVTDDLEGSLAGAAAAIDFSSPASTRRLLAALAATPRPAVIGTTGLDGETLAAAREAARRAPLVVSPNLSRGVAVLKRLLAEALRLLPGFDVEIVEAHHRAKADAPSGTAGDLLRIVREGRGEAGGLAVHGRQGRGEGRAKGEVGVHAVRGGTVTGEHAVLFLGEAERVELRHTAESRAIFAHGAVAALRWVAGKPPGLYTPDDVYR